jgi:hypothetical protein
VVQELWALAVERAVDRVTEAMMMATFRSPTTVQDGKPHEEEAFAWHTRLPQLPGVKD